MGKKTFVDGDPSNNVLGTIVDAAFLNALNNHKHTGLDIDGEGAWFNPFIDNIKLVVNASVNKLDVFTKSGGGVPDSSNIIGVAIPDGTGLAFRTRAAAYLSGTSQFILADAANYWSKGSLDAEIKTAWLYAIWDGTGIVLALGGYAGFNVVPTSTTVTDDDYFLLEAGSTYTRNASHYCVCVGKIRYQYDTADTPDHTIQATGEHAPKVLWNPKSDYGYTKKLASDNISATDIADYAACTIQVKQSGKYLIMAESAGVVLSGTTTVVWSLAIKTGATAIYGSATVRQSKLIKTMNATDCYMEQSASHIMQLTAGDYVFLGTAVITTGATNSREILAQGTALSITKLD